MIPLAIDFMRHLWYNETMNLAPIITIDEQIHREKHIYCLYEHSMKVWGIKYLCLKDCITK